MNYIEVYFNGILKHSLSIQTDIISIGRASSNNIVINNMGVSNLHAIITKKNNLLFIEDLNSSNGTFLNSEKISSQQRIHSQDSIIIGKHTIKFSEWSQMQETASKTSHQETDAATVIMSSKATIKSNQSTSPSTFYLISRGELTNINKLLLTENNYSIGKAKDNDIRIGGWFTSAYIAEIEKIGHSFYISPIKKNIVKLNDSKINSSTLLAPFDEIRIKSLFLKFLTD